MHVEKLDEATAFQWRIYLQKGRCLSTHYLDPHTNNLYMKLVKYLRIELLSLQYVKMVMGAQIKEVDERKHYCFRKIK